MSWGKMLVLAFVGFASLMGTLIYKCLGENYELVSKEYYNEELKYQDKIDGAENANRLSSAAVKEEGNNIILQLPAEHKGLALTGDLWFYCATDASSDRKLPLRVNDEGSMVIDKKILAKTNYLLKITWLVGKEKFYKELPLVTHS